MAKKVLGGIEVEVDEDGFVQEPAKWTRAVAEDLAREDGIYPMTDDHWKVIDCIRNHYLQHGVASPIKVMTQQTGFKLKYIYDLFSKGPAYGACRVAGLPKPLGCL
jgi:TusE/DsrC/DsvC family sulfur relay protein